MLRKPSHATVIAYLALFFAMGGTAVAATGGTFILGKANSATTTTGLTNTNGPALTLSSKAGTAPFTTNSSTKVARLNADALDGLDQASFQRRVGGYCPNRAYLRGINPNGSVTCEAVTGKVIQVVGVLETEDPEFMGQGFAECPSGYAVVGGGWGTGGDEEGAPPVPVVAQFAAPVSFTFFEQRVNIFSVGLTKVDGSPYTGGGGVIAQCVQGTSYDAPMTMSSLRASGSQQPLAQYTAYRMSKR